MMNETMRRIGLTAIIAALAVVISLGIQLTLKGFNMAELDLHTLVVDAGRFLLVVYIVNSYIKKAKRTAAK